MIYFVRHGQSTANAGGVTMAHAAIPLSELGRRQAAMVAELLDVEPILLLSSTYVRAVETARPFSEKTGCPITPPPLLHEFSALDAGLIECMVTAQRRPMADAFWSQADPDLLRFQRRRRGGDAGVHVIPARAANAELRGLWKWCLQAKTSCKRSRLPPTHMPSSL